MTDAKGLEDALVEVGIALARDGYHFWTPTPETHAKVVARLKDERGDEIVAKTKQDLWGWSLPVSNDSSFVAGLSQSSQDKLLSLPDANANGHRRALARFSSLYPSATSSEQEKVLYAHSPWPTSDQDAVFFGPDTYRFLRFLSAAFESEHRTFRLAVDVGCGAGAGAIHVAGAKVGKSDTKACQRVIGLDVNAKAFVFARANSALHRIAMDNSEGSTVEWRKSDLFSALSKAEEAELDLVVSNPPYIAFDADKGSTYADGGGESGLSLPILIARQAVDRLSTGGLCMLYTGVPIRLDGHDPLRAAMVAEKDRAELVSYDVMDVDVFGDELRDAKGAYSRSDVGQIAVIGAVLRKR